MEKLIPDAGLCVINGTGHFSFIQRPYEVHTIIASFLGGN
jgi:pimeloyl-ACP methyl ester carboxylesterase